MTSTTKQRSDTTIAINGNRKVKLQDAAVEITIQTKRTIKNSEIVHYLIDHYLRDGVKDIISARKAEEKT